MPCPTLKKIMNEFLRHYFVVNSLVTKCMLNVQFPLYMYMYIPIVASSFGILFMKVVLLQI